MTRKDIAIFIGLTAFVIGMGYVGCEVQQYTIRRAVRDVVAESQSTCRCGAECSCPEGRCCKSRGK